MLNKQQVQYISDLNKAQISQKQQYLTQKRKECLELHTDIEIHIQSINEKAQVVEAEFDDAKSSVRKAIHVISRSNYSSRKSCCGTGIGGGYCCALSRPPNYIQSLFSTVCLLMGKRCKTWRVVYKIIHHKKDFLESVMRFDAKNIKEETRKKAKKNLLSSGIFKRKKLTGNKLKNLIYGYTVGNTKQFQKPIPLEINDIIVLFCKDTLEYVIFLNLWDDGLAGWYNSKYGGFLLWCKAQCKLAHVLDSVDPVEKEIKWLKERLVLKQQKAHKLAQMIVNKESE